MILTVPDSPLPLSRPIKSNTTRSNTPNSWIDIVDSDDDVGFVWHFIGDESSSNSQYNRQSILSNRQTERMKIRALECIKTLNGRLQEKQPVGSYRVGHREAKRSRKLKSCDQISRMDEMESSDRPKRKSSDDDVLESTFHIRIRRRHSDPIGLTCLYSRQPKISEIADDLICAPNSDRYFSDRLNEAFDYPSQRGQHIKKGSSFNLSFDDKGAIEYIRLMKDSYSELELCVSLDWLPGILHIANRQPQLFKCSVRRWLVISSTERLLKQRTALPFKASSIIGHRTLRYSAIDEHQIKQYGLLKESMPTVCSTPSSFNEMPQSSSNKTTLNDQHIVSDQPITEVKDRVTLFPDEWIVPPDLPRHSPRCPSYQRQRQNISTELKFPSCDLIIRSPIRSDMLSEQRTLEEKEEKRRRCFIQQPVRRWSGVRLIRSLKKTTKDDDDDIWDSLPPLSELLSHIILQYGLLDFQHFIKLCPMTERATSIVQWYLQIIATHSDIIIKDSHQFRTLIWILEALQNRLTCHPVISLHFNSLAIEAFRCALWFRYHQLHCLKYRTRRSFIWIKGATNHNSPKRNKLSTLSWPTPALTLSTPALTRSTLPRVPSTQHRRRRMIIAFRCGDRSIVENLTRHLLDRTSLVVTEDIKIETPPDRNI